MSLLFMFSLVQLGSLLSETKFLNPCDAGEFVYTIFMKLNIEISQLSSADRHCWMGNGGKYSKVLACRLWRLILGCCLWVFLFCSLCRRILAKQITLNGENVISSLLLHHNNVTHAFTI